MKRIDHRTVELTAFERQVSDLFERFLDAGYTIDQALDSTTKVYPGLSPEFIEWLS